MGKLIHEALSEHIFGVAMAVLNELKPGLDACPPPEGKAL